MNLIDEEEARARTGYSIRHLRRITILGRERFQYPGDRRYLYDPEQLHEKHDPNIAFREVNRGRVVVSGIPFPGWVGPVLEDRRNRLRSAGFQQIAGRS